MQTAKLQTVQVDRAAFRVLVSFSLLSALAIPAIAHAQESSQSDALLGSSTEVTVGLGTGFTPRFLGSSETRVLPVPVISLQRGVLFADITRGIGAEYETTSGLYFSAALGYDGGRTTKDSAWRAGSKKLAGMGDIKSSATLDLVVSQQITSWLSVNGAAGLQLAGQHNRGNDYRLGLHADLLDTNTDELALDASAHIGDGDYNQTYFGVSRSQSRSSRFARHDAGAGLYAYSLSGSWIHRLDKNWSVATVVNVMQLTGDAGDSPIVSEKTAVTGITTVNYSF